MRQDRPEDVLRERLTFYPVILMSTLFCISIFIVIAATFGDQNISVNQWINRNANAILIVETVVLMLTAVGAMTIDRLRTLKRLATEQQRSDTAENSTVTASASDSTADNCPQDNLKADADASKPTSEGTRDVG